MKDMNGRDIQVNDQVRAVEAMDGFTSYGMIYQVKGLRPEEGRVVITDDNGREQWCRATRFKVVKDEEGTFFP